MEKGLRVQKLNFLTPQCQTKRILIADDDDDSLYTLRMQLQLDGFKDVFCVSDGQQAIQHLTNERVDLVLLDVMMPRVNGIDVLMWMRSEPAVKDIPAIMISAISQTDTIVACIRKGASDYVTKPFDTSALLCRVKGALTVAPTKRTPPTGESLAKIKCAAFLLNEQATVIHQNKSATDLLALEDTLQLRDSTLTAKLRANNVVLAREVLQATGSQDRLFALARPDKTHPLLARVGPWKFSAGTLRLLLVINPEHRPVRRVSEELVFLGLTPREAGVAELIANGCSPLSVATILGIKESTVRTLLKHVFSKLHISRQSELSRLAAQIALLGMNFE